MKNKNKYKIRLCRRDGTIELVTNEDIIHTALTCDIDVTVSIFVHLHRRRVNGEPWEYVLKVGIIRTSGVANLNELKQWIVCCRDNPIITIHDALGVALHSLIGKEILNKTFAPDEKIFRIQYSQMPKIILPLMLRKDFNQIAYSDYKYEYATN